MNTSFIIPTQCPWCLLALFKCKLCISASLTAPNIIMTVFKQVYLTCVFHGEKTDSPASNWHYWSSQCKVRPSWAAQIHRLHFSLELLVVQIWHTLAFHIFHEIEKCLKQPLNGFIMLQKWNVCLGDMMSEWVYHKVCWWLSHFFLKFNVSCYQLPSFFHKIF